MNSTVISIARELEERFLAEKRADAEFFVFLCGGADPDQEALRRGIGRTISSISLRSRYRYTAYYPEDMFIELILGHARRDLLSLENMLAESAHAVAILLDGPGTFAELGAFTNHEMLKDKLVLVIDPRYQRSKSFINLGPVRYLQRSSHSKIHYIGLNEGNERELARAIAVSTREIAKHSPPRQDLTNPLFAYDFYLALVFVFDPVPREAVPRIASELAKRAGDKAIDAAETVVNSLINEGNVICEGGTLACTRGGIYRLYMSQPKLRMLASRRMLSNIRYRVLNKLYRGKAGTKGGAFDI